MSKSKQTTLFDTKDGIRARFNSDEFKYYINEVRKQSKINKLEKQETLDSIFQKLAIALWGECSEEVLISHIGTIKQWYYGYNGPSDLDYIYRMAECLKCERRDQFLKYEKTEVKQMKDTVDNIQNANTIVMPTIKMLVEANYRAMKRMRAQEEAYKLHAMFFDLISAYNEANMETWLGNEPMSAEWKEAAKCYPNRRPMYLAIEKASCFLPSEIRHGLHALLEDMYGAPLFEWSEVNTVGPDTNYFNDYSGVGEFIDNKLKRFSAYLVNQNVDESALSAGDRDIYLFDFLHDEASNWAYELDRILEYFIVD